MKKIICFLLLGWVWGVGRGQGASTKSSRPDSPMIQFLAGHWVGKGEFANGRAIEADVEFSVALDSSWIVNSHKDRPPGHYQATSYWGMGRGMPFAAFTFDNYHGHRQWTSNGWVDGRLVLTGSEPAGGGVMFEHFIYERVSDGRFKMTYEVSGDGIVWRMGDWLVFSKVPVQ